MISVENQTQCVVDDSRCWILSGKYAIWWIIDRLFEGSVMKLETNMDEVWC